MQVLVIPSRCLHREAAPSGNSPWNEPSGGRSAPWPARLTFSATNGRSCSSATWPAGRRSSRSFPPRPSGSRRTSWRIGSSGSSPAVLPSPSSRCTVPDVVATVSLARGGRCCRCSRPLPTGGSHTSAAPKPACGRCPRSDGQRRRHRVAPGRPVQDQNADAGGAVGRGGDQYNAAVIRTRQRTTARNDRTHGHHSGCRGSFEVCADRHGRDRRKPLSPAGKTALKRHVVVAGLGKGVVGIDGFVGAVAGSPAPEVASFKGGRSMLADAKSGLKAKNRDTNRWILEPAAET